MRLKLLAAALALLPLPAYADVTARYTADKQLLLVEVDDGGNSRIGIEGKFGVIHRDGTDYLLVITPTGEAHVTELAEVINLLATMIGGGNKPGIPGAESMHFVLTAKGAATISGRAGSAWSFGPAPTPGADAAKQERNLDIVVSGDPALAPVGTIFRRTIDTVRPLLRLMFPDSSGFGNGLSEIVAKGTPLRIAPVLELQSVDTAEIDAKRFELPAPVMPAMEFMQLAGGGGLGDLPPLP